jgi:hypoxanthine phosphoribosyltransferase
MKYVGGEKGFPVADEIVTATDLATGFDRLAQAVQPLVDRGDCILLAVMTGGFYPLIRLADRLHGDFLIDYCHATRYAGATEGGMLDWRELPHLNLAGRTVILVDDIYDAGITLQAVAGYCREAGAVQVSTAVMVVKDRQRAADMPAPDFTTGLRVPDRYVFGCGMDVYGRWRHLPAIYALADQSAVKGTSQNG